MKSDELLVGVYVLVPGLGTGRIASLGGLEGWIAGTVKVVLDGGEEVVVPFESLKLLD